MPDFIKLQCPMCGTLTGRITSRKDGTRRCLACGHIGSWKEFDVKPEEPKDPGPKPDEPKP